ncbi:MAG: permease [Chloroflexota bacterium]|nr:permease [Chloroflexota bacterium]
MNADFKRQMAEAGISQDLQKSRKNLLMNFRWVLLIALADGLVWLFFPAQAPAVANNTWEYLEEVVVILIPVALLMGLLEVWVPKQMIAKYLGRESGWKGIALAFLFGTLPTGPLYIAFPIAGMLLRNGASVFNLVVFLDTWAAIKIPQMILEVQFLGPSFMLMRLALTLPSVIAMGWLIQKMVAQTGGADLPATTAAPRAEPDTAP